MSVVERFLVVDVVGRFKEFYRGLVWGEGMDLVVRGEDWSAGEVEVCWFWRGEFVAEGCHF